MHYENYGRFNVSHHVSTTKLTLFVVNKDEWYTKEARAKQGRIQSLERGGALC